MGWPFKGRKLLNRSPIAFEGPLVKQTERSLFLRNRFLAQDLVHIQVEIPKEEFDAAVDLFASSVASIRFGRGQRLKLFVAARDIFEQEKSPKPFRLACQNQSCIPSLPMLERLRTREAVNVCTVLCDLDKETQIMTDKLCFVLRPYRLIGAFVGSGFSKRTAIQIGK